MKTLLIVEVVYLCFKILTADLVDNPEGVKILPILVDFGQQNIELYCTTKQTKNLNAIQWRRGMQTISVGERVFMTSDYGIKKSIYDDIVLIIKKINSQTVAKYSCINTTNNKESQVLKEFEIKLKEKPKIANYSDTDLVVSEGSDAQLWCIAESVIKSNTTWYLRNNNSSSESKQEIPIGITGSVLQIVNITKYCSATYSCVVINAKGKAIKDFNVSVRYKPILKTELIVDGRLVNHENNIAKIKTGASVVIRCLVDANPRIDTILWNTNNKLIASKNTTEENPKIEKEFGKRYLVTSDPINDQGQETLNLHITKATKKDIKTFSCLATNTFGSKSINLTIVGT